MSGVRQNCDVFFVIAAARVIWAVCAGALS